ncbi:hypothetical protein HA145_07005 [Prochlorococcus marinus XMU1411]|uniref:hypothetical protein n=1 Tax=Prochlorococcus marinus TaxID=1219 RepID=UPI001ADAE930|nr:hypothetical protein [Prochlorococcus marinus]MBO8244224.1 hypothetical protein [Prochlorococcus marinus XMU1411]MBW3055310.1 hypothetical protein [Prochlorococcus marinus str. MU1411]MCR8537052.1 hypothetical protein [Prochlorococcus marinus CUG1430]
MLRKIILKLTFYFEIILDFLNWTSYFQKKHLLFQKSFDNHQIALISNLHSNIASSKVDAIFTIGLRKKNHKIVVLLNKKNIYTQLIYVILGKVEFIYLEDFIFPEDYKISKKRVKKIISQNKNTRSLFNYEENNVRLGRNALSSTLRKLRIGSLNFENQQHIKEIEKNLLLSLNSKVATERILNYIKPNLLIFIERGYSPSGELFDNALNMGINVIQYLSGPENNNLIFKSYNSKNKNDHPISIGKDTMKVLNNLKFDSQDQKKIIDKIKSNYEDGKWFNRQQLQLGKLIFSPDETRKLLKVEKGRKVAVIFSHILYDATFFYGNNIFEDYEKWLIETIKFAIDNTNLDWIIKVHPVNVWRSKMDKKPLEQLELISVKKHIGSLPSHVRFLHADSKVNTYSLFNLIDYGLTVRGTIGMELPCWGIPVVTAGTGRYSGNGFTIDPDDIKTYQQTLENIHNLSKLSKEEILRAQKYVYAVLYGKQIKTNSFKIVNYPNKENSNFQSNTFVDRRFSNNFLDVDYITDWMVNPINSDLMSEIFFKKLI